MRALNPSFCTSHKAQPSTRSQDRLHKADPSLPQHAEDKRSLIHVESPPWGVWLRGPNDEAWQVPQLPAEAFDLSDAVRTTRPWPHLARKCLEVTSSVPMVFETGH